MQADMRDVAIYRCRKIGILKMSDSGLTDVLLKGAGLNVSTLLRVSQSCVYLVSSRHNRFSVFRVWDIHAKAICHPWPYKETDSKR